MLDFRRGPRPRNYLSRREQWRLLVLVVMLGLVVILMLEALNLKSYPWFRAVVQGETGGAAGGPSGDNRPVDTRVLAEVREEEIPGTFLSPAPVKPAEAKRSRYFPGVQPSYLDSIRDNKPLGSSEWGAWLHLFDVLEKNDEATLQRASTGRVGFVQLLEQSGEYRGELVTTGGTLRRAHPAKTPKNDYGLTDYYQTWLSPADHPQDPMAVWCLHLPEGFPTGMQIAEEAEVTGFYFKLWAYKAADGTVRRAPMLLARTIHWQQGPEVVPTRPQGSLPLVLMTAGAAAFAVLAAVYVLFRTRGRRPSRRESLLKEAALRDVEASAGVGTALQQLADSEDAPGP